MCEPISASTAAWLAVGSGAVSFAGSAMTAIGQHQAQQAAVARSNAIAQQQYQRELQIAAARDQEKGRVYEAELNATTAAKNAYYAQKSANQLEANRALRASQNKYEERANKLAFEGQTAIANAVKAQGQVLSTGRAGQSFLLQAMDAERQLGYEQAQIDATLQDSNRARGIENEGILLDQYASNMVSWNNLPADPLSPQASFLPVKPIMASGPSGLALAGTLVSAGMSAAETGLGTYGRIAPANNPD